YPVNLVRCSVKVNKYCDIENYFCIIRKDIEDKNVGLNSKIKQAVRECIYTVGTILYIDKIFPDKQYMVCFD
ncbi:MAG: hypothetical protein AABY84_10345, partial [Candidatus Firestonebacteria bacterium]